VRARSLQRLYGLDGIMPSTAGRRNMSNWQDERAKRNRQSIARLTRALPGIVPSNVLSRAFNRPFVPPTPRLAIDSYWRAHPIRADRLARSLAVRSGAPHGWTWDVLSFFPDVDRDALSHQTAAESGNRDGAQSRNLLAVGRGRRLNARGS
jgi:hypothetical protein